MSHSTFQASDRAGVAAGTTAPQPSSAGSGGTGSRSLKTKSSCTCPSGRPGADHGSTMRRPGTRSYVQISSDSAPAPLIPARPSAAAAMPSSIRPVRPSSIRQVSGTTTKSRSPGSRAASSNQSAISALPRSTSESAHGDSETASRTASIAARRARTQATVRPGSSKTGSPAR